MRITVQLTGLDKLSLAVGYMKTAASTGLKFGVSEGGGLVLNEAKINVPKVSGNLDEHIHMEIVTDEPEVQVVAVTPIFPASNKYGFDPAYARRVHDGFIGVDSLGRHYHQAANPFLTAAYETQKKPAIDAIRNGLYQELDAVVGGK